MPPTPTPQQQEQEDDLLQLAAELDEATTLQDLLVLEPPQVGGRH
jgi:hypothetical protein